MANLYDPLMNYLAKEGECPVEVALTLLKGYGHVESKYNAINRLVRAKKITRFQHDGIAWIKLLVTPTKFVKRQEPKAEHDTTLEDIAGIYRFIVRFGVQHYSTPGRANINAVTKIWLDQRRDLIQFLNLLKDLIDNDTTSHLEYRELEAGLKEAGWYTSNGDVLDSLSWFGRMLNPEMIGGALGISHEDWESLQDVHSLRRINITEEH